MKQYLLFDLDGTLTDPKVGITTCVQYALASFGIEEPDLDKLDPFIGPPLKDSFMNFYDMSEEQAQAAVDKYRERFRDTGIFENRLYDGVPKMLRALNDKGMVLAVASSKPTVFVERILEHFRIARYFKVVVGSELDGTRVNKEEVVEEALKRLFGDRPVEKDKVYMIGDRRFDTEGAKAQGIESVGVTYGYGSMEELKEAKTDYIVCSVEELKRFLLRDTKEQTASPFLKVWQILFPLVIFWLLRNLGEYLTALGLLLAKDHLPRSIRFLFFWILSGQGGFGGLNRNAVILMMTVGSFLGTAAVWKTAKARLEDTAEDMRLLHLKKEPAKNYFLLFFLTVGAAIGLNLLLKLAGITGLSQSYQESAYLLNTTVLWLRLPYYGLIAPIAEEILFRGIIYGYLRRMMRLRPAMFMSALLFGMYHMNPVQGIYGFLMGCLMVYAYEYFGDFKASLAVHIIANLLALCIAYARKYVWVKATVYGPVNVSPAMNWAVCIGFLALAAGSFLLLYRQKKVC